MTRQFMGRQIVLSAVILYALAAWFRTSTDLHVNPRITIAGLVLAPVGLSTTIASTWIGSGRWDDLARFPLRRDELVRATYLVAGAVVLLEVVVPITLFITLANDRRGGPSSEAGTATTTAVEMVIIGLGAPSSGLTLWAGERIGLHWTAGGIPAAGTLLQWLTPAASALLFAVCAVAIFGYADGLRMHRTQMGTIHSRRSLILDELATVRTTQASTFMILVVGLLFTYTVARRGLTIPLPMAFVVVNTPLNAYFSRYLSTRTVVMAALGPGRVLVTYARDLTLLYTMSNCLVGALTVWLGGGLAEVVTAGVAVSFAGALAAVLLEVYRLLAG